MQDLLPAGLSLRPLTSAGEVEACARLMSTSEPWITLGRTYEASLEILRDEAKETYVARDGEEIAGFLVLDMRGAFVGYLQTICLRPEYRGRGLGRGMIRWAEQRIFTQSPNVFMCVSSFNHDARRLYERIGYKVVGELTDYLVPGCSEVLLRKTIGPWSAFRKKE